MTRTIRKLFGTLPMIVPAESLQAIEDILEGSRGASKEGDKEIEQALTALRAANEFHIQKEAFEYALRLGDDARQTFWHRLLNDSPANDESCAYETSAEVTVSSTQHRMKTGHEIEYFRGSDKIIIAAKCHVCSLIWRVAMRTNLDD